MFKLDRSAQPSGRWAPNPLIDTVFLLLFVPKKKILPTLQPVDFAYLRSGQLILAFAVTSYYNRSMFRDLMFILLGLALLSVLAVLGAGIVGLVRGSDPRQSNKLMQWRVALQALALLLVVLILTIFRDR